MAMYKQVYKVTFSFETLRERSISDGRLGPSAGTLTRVERDANEAKGLAVLSKRIKKN